LRKKKKFGHFYDYRGNKLKLTDWRVSLIEGIAKGMAYLHSDELKFLHKSLNSENIAIIFDGSIPIAKIHNFGFPETPSIAQFYDNTSMNCHLATLAPECISGGSVVHQKSEVFSFGIILWELLTQEKPILYTAEGREMEPKEIKLYILNGGRLPLPSAITLNKLPRQCESYVRLIRECWKQNPEERPSFSGIIKFLDIEKPIAGKANMNKGKTNITSKREFHYHFQVNNVLNTVLS